MPDEYAKIVKWTVLNSVTHNQVTVSNIQYKNVNNSWISLNSSNSTSPSSTIKWPVGRAHYGTPQDYSISVQPGSSLMYASLFYIA
ncbi:hypothetical protein PPYC1_13740 [Paenibacillus polymyxa]|uniref:hypothetical protein n=1 Tax=Paenibacillus polymyxa TaxID=1406 RepID=UPI0008FC1F3F|nr:hypothetical protein [Paenibacillus polymyxa]APB71357.1 hypothetical protein PPYC1_13740 [Paenibacillus polymyxa]